MQNFSEQLLLMKTNIDEDKKKYRKNNHVKIVNLILSDYLPIISC